MNVNGVLLLYHHHLKANAPTISEHVRSFSQHSRFRVWNVNTALGFPTRLERLRFSVILLHYSIFGLPIILNEKFLEYIRSSRRSYKIAFLQDEHRYWPERSAFLNSYGIDCVYTLLEPQHFQETYLKHTGASKMVYNLPGYVSEEMLEMARRHSRPDTKRRIDIGYRGRKLPYYMGRGSQEKHLIGVEFKRRASNLGLRIDIETDEKRRIYGQAWPQFLGDCKAVLGVEAGVSVFDIDDAVRPQYQKICKGHPDISFPDCSFEKFHDAVLVPYEDRIYYRTISPRHFEAAAFRNCQILFEGKYSGILKPMVHYIPLKKNFSNFDDVIRMFHDSNLRKELTENAYRDLIASGEYSYQRFIRGFDKELESRELSHEISDLEAQKVTRLIKRGRLERYAWVVLAIARQTEFPGRSLLNPFLKPLFRRLRI